jgi:hypothetical protein
VKKIETFGSQSGATNKEIIITDCGEILDAPKAAAKPKVEEVKPKVEEVKPKIEEVKPKVEEVKPASKVAKPTEVPLSKEEKSLHKTID